MVHNTTQWHQNKIKISPELKASNVSRDYVASYCEPCLAFRAGTLTTGIGGS